LDHAFSKHDERKTNEMHFKPYILNINSLLHVSAPQERHLQGAQSDPAEILFMLRHKSAEHVKVGSGYRLVLSVAGSTLRISSHYFLT
jgi:hypothetical protein